MRPIDETGASRGPRPRPGVRRPACKEDAVAPGAKTAEQGDPTMKTKRELFGRLADGTAVDIYTLTNASGLEARVMTYGAILVSLKVPDRNGVLADVNLGFDTLAGLSRHAPVLRGHHRALRQPHRQGPVHPGRRRVQARPEQQRQHPPRRDQGLRQGRLEGRAGQGRRTARASS